MNDDGQLSRFAPAPSAAGRLAFCMSRGRMVVKIVEPDFSPSDHLGMARPFEHSGIGGRRWRDWLREDEFQRWPRFADIPVCRHISRPGECRSRRCQAFAVADGEIGFDAILFRASQNLVAIAVVAFAFEMGVRVDEHCRWSLFIGGSCRGWQERAKGPSPHNLSAPQLLFKTRTDRDIFEKACQDRLSTLGRSGDDHAIRFQSAQFAGS